MPLVYGEPEAQTDDVFGVHIGCSCRDFLLVPPVRWQVYRTPVPAVTGRMRCQCFAFTSDVRVVTFSEFLLEGWAPIDLAAGGEVRPVPPCTRS